MIKSILAFVDSKPLCIIKSNKHFRFSFTVVPLPIIFISKSLG